MNRANVLGLCSVVRLARPCHRRRCAHRPAAGREGCRSRMAPANRARWQSLPARLTDPAPHPDAFVLVVVRITEPSSVANDRVLPADGTSPRQEVQRNHPGSVLSSASGSAIKRITAGVKAAADRPCQSFDLRPAFTLPAKSVPNEKKNTDFRCSPRAPHSKH